MTWEYRVMRKVGGDGTIHYYTYGIYEVYNRPSGWTKESMTPECTSIEELKADHDFMGRAFDKPILDYHTGRKVKK